MLNSHIFHSVVVHGKMNGAEGASTNLLLYSILVDAMDCSTVIFAIRVLGASMKRFLYSAWSGGFATVMPEGTLVRWRRPVKCTSASYWCVLKMRTNDLQMRHNCWPLGVVDHSG